MNLKLNKLSKILGLEILNLDLKKVIDKSFWKQGCGSGGV